MNSNMEVVSQTLQTYTNTEVQANPFPYSLLCSWCFATVIVPLRKVPRQIDQQEREVCKFVYS